LGIATNTGVNVDLLIDVLYMLELWEQGEITDEELQEIIDGE
jgi:hypothetical protein|tara:strand:- start:317 stop:442 length:126 start_codon:yes stop_codon:yes gene_type:complete